MITHEVKHINQPGQVEEGVVFKIHNEDKVFFIVEKVLNHSGEIEEYVARKLDGKEIGEIKYNPSNDSKKLSFQPGSIMKVDHIFVYGKMFKSYS